MIAHLDLETFSDCDLKTEGLYRYAAHPSTEVLVACYAFDDGPVHVWVPDMTALGVVLQLQAKGFQHVVVQRTCPDEIRTHIESGGQVRAHNAAFERVVLNGVAGQKIGFPLLKSEQMVCTMAKMAAHGLPHALENAAAALGTHPKDAVGANDMRYCCKRRADGTQPTPQDEPERFLRLYAYCADDVEAERGIDRVVPDLSPHEQKVWEMDQRMNDRGWKVDLPRIADAQALINEYKAQLAQTCRDMTGCGPSQTAKLADWCRDNGYLQLADMQVGTVNAAVADPECPADVKKLLSLFSTHNMKAVTKYDAMARAAGDDGRLRGMFQYYGANTGRWCLTGDHEVMTPEGWKCLAEWPGGSLLCWDEVSGKMDFARGEANRFYYEGDMIAWDVERFAQVATPEHRMPVVGKPGGVPVQEIVGKTDYIPRTGLSPCGSRYSEAQLRFFVMAQADGYYKDGVWKFSFTKTRKESRCRSLLKWLGLEFNYNSYPNDCSGKTRFVFTIHSSLNPRDAKWLAALGPRKEFPWELLYADHDTFFEELTEWDSYRCGPRSVQYTTTNRRNADFVQAKAHMANRQCSITIKRRQGGEAARGRADAYYCSIWLSAAPAGTRSARKTEQRMRHEGDVFCPCTPTGFFLVRRSGRCWITGNSSKIVQLQNLYRPKIDDPEVAVEAFAARDLEWVKALYSDVGPMKALASCIRSMLVSEEDKDLLFLDYSGIEARVNAWLWGEHWKLDAFRAFDAGTGPDLYKLAYARSFRVPVDEVSKAQRQVGKVMELALGYEGGVSAFVTMAGTYGLDLAELTQSAYTTLPVEVREEAHAAWDWAVDQKRTLDLDQRTYVVCDAFKRLWRNTHPGITKGWRDLKDSAIKAIASPGQVFPVAHGRVMFKVQGDWLYMRLPSGRRLAYYKPQYDETDGQLSYLGVDTYTRRWCRTKTYSGRLDEQLCQAVSRDVMAQAKLRLDPAGYPPVGSVHDEIIMEIPEDFGSLEEASQIMCVNPKWAEGLPLAVEGHRAKRYRK